MLPESVLRLTGEVLAHAAWSISDVPAEELLTPLIMTELDGRREMMRFEADTQDAAIAEARRTLATLAGKVAAWAFAWEGTLRDDGGASKQDVLVVEFSDGEPENACVLVQPVQRETDTSPFRILGKPTITQGSQSLDSGLAESLLAGIQRGVLDHTGVTDLWPVWQRSE